MLTLSDLWNELLSAIAPAHCVACSERLSSRQYWICSSCRADIPLTNFHLERENPMLDKLKPLCPAISYASAHYFFVHKGRWRGVIHNIKYKGDWLSARRLGYWYGSDLAQAAISEEIDVIIPIPLHPLKRLKRGYNQSEHIAHGISKALNMKVDTSSVRRVRNNPSQVSLSSSNNRWDNVDGIFSVKRNHKLNGKHILLIDDVFTTGATILSCAEAILASAPDCTISVATLAVSTQHISI